MASLSDSLRDAVFYGILDTGYVCDADLYAKCQALIDAGCKIIQLRAKKQDATRRREMAFEILPLFKNDIAPYFIINDDVELAREICRLIPNGGLHVGQDDLSPQDARAAIGKDRVLGLSTHSINQASAADALADTLDYFAVGPVFATNTKPGRAAVGLDLVSEVSRMCPVLPWFAIGGVNLKTARAVNLAGAKRIVAVSDVLVPSDTRAAVKQLLQVFIGK